MQKPPNGITCMSDPDAILDAAEAACCVPAVEARSLAPELFAVGAGESALIEELSVLAKALAHPARIKVMCLLSQRTCISGDLVDELGLAQSTVSQHLKVLRDAGLILGEIQGPATCYSTNQAMLRRLRMLVSAL